MQDSPNNSRRFAFAVVFCALAIAAGWQAPAAAAQGAAMAAVSTKPDTPAPLANAARSATGRTKAEKPANRYFIEFQSRNALSYGHAYVVYGRLDSKGHMVEPHIGGIHPASTSSIPYMIGHLIPVPAEHGATDGDMEEEYVSARYRVMLSEAEYNRVAAYIKELEATTPVWHAVLYSCISFVNDVAKFMGLRTPPTGMYPEVFINNLRAMNSASDEEITLIPRVQWGLAPASPPVTAPPQ